MKITNLVRTDFEVISPEETLSEIEDRLTKGSYLLVKDQEAFVGILSSFQKLTFDDRRVVDSLKDATEVDVNSEIDEVSRLMQKTGQDIVPVFDQNRFRGVISQKDVIASLIEVNHDLEQKFGLVDKQKSEILKKVKEEIGLNEKSRVLVFNTEGVTDPDTFEELISREVEV